MKKAERRKKAEKADLVMQLAFWVNLTAVSWGPARSTVFLRETIVKATILPEYGQERYSWLPTVVCSKCRIDRLAKWGKELADGVNAE